MDVATARALILAQSTINHDLVNAVARNEIKIDGSGNVQAPNPQRVYTNLADVDLINFALALGNAGSVFFSGASIDLNFVTGAYLNFGSIATTRATTATNLIPSSASGFAYSTFGTNVSRITSGLGLLVEETRTNVLLNSLAPITQTVTLNTLGGWTLWVNGSGSATASAGTANISFATPATNGSPNTFVVNGTGTVIITVTGSLNSFQLELSNDFEVGTSLIITGGSAVQRNYDNIVWTTTAPSNGWFYAEFTPQLKTVNQCVIGDANGTPNYTTPMQQDSGGSGFMTSYSAAALATTANSVNLNVINKAAMTWGPAGTSICLNNGIVATSATEFTPNTIYLLGYNSSLTANINGYIRRIAIGAQTLSSAQLGSITT